MKPSFSLVTSLFLLAGFCLPPAAVAQAGQALELSQDRRHLVYADQTPFFYLGDTAWELFHRLNREEVDAYLTDRAHKGFTVIQAVVLAELDGLNTPNPYGHTPLIENDPTRPNPAYFEHVDYIVNKAEELGIFIGMLPTWGDKFNKKWGVGPVCFTPENALVYGRYLGQRYKNKPIIWILGGDRSPEEPQHFEIIRAMATGLKEGDGGRNLMTYHPMGGACSADWFHNDAWLDFNMFQSGHSRANEHNHNKTLAVRMKTPTKPVLDGEPRYEDHPIDWKPENGWFDDWDVRQAAYWSMLCGAAGHTYGNHNIWQMWQPGRGPISSARTPWETAVGHPGSQQMGHMRRLFESLDWQSLEPYQAILKNDGGNGAGHIRAALSTHAGFALVYTPMGKTIELELGDWTGMNIQASWFNPRNGRKTEIGPFKIDNLHTFPPPSIGRGNDWLLILQRQEG
ncbi:MAG: glycoside hydrolase family 140 protein [Verrucomicrobiota bacterium]|nr:glycoside hydrolase family 140 protein [Verrucomicrobiota bacterium]